MGEQTNIIAIGGGKGGIGKSVISTNLAVGLALGGQSVVLIDTDFGAANLHALLGISNPARGFVDFFTQPNPNASSLLLDTGVSNLKFLSGAGDNPGSANLAPEHKNKILDFIKTLRADHIILDLGPGTSYGVLDYYNLADHGLALTIPEMPAVMNSFSFIKAALFRKIGQTLSNHPVIGELTDFSKNPQAANEVYSMDNFKKIAAGKNPMLPSRIDDIVADFKPNLVLNRVRRKSDLVMGQNLIKLIRKYLNVEPKYLGYIVESDKVRDSVNEMVPFLIKDPQSKPSENLQKVINALTQSGIHLIKRDGMILVSKQIQLASGWRV